MKTRAFNNEVLYPAETPVVVDRAFMEELQRQSELNPRRRIRLCAHSDPKDSLHDMLIVHTSGTYVRPHKHLSKVESFHVISGTAEVVLFDDAGRIRRVVPMGPYESGRNFYYRLADAVYHTLVIHTPYLVFHEATNGPFDRADTVFPDWAPADDPPAAAAAYLANLRALVSAAS